MNEIKIVDGSGNSFLETALRHARKAVFIGMPSLDHLPNYVSYVLSQVQKGEHASLIESLMRDTKYYIDKGVAPNNIADILSSRGYFLEDMSPNSNGDFVKTRCSIVESAMELWIIDNIYSVYKNGTLLFRDSKDYCKSLFAFVKDRFRGYSHIPKPSECAIDFAIDEAFANSFEKAILSSYSYYKSKKGKKKIKSITRNYMRDYLLTRYYAEMDFARSHAYKHIDRKRLFRLMNAPKLTKNSVKMSGDDKEGHPSRFMDDITDIQNYLLDYKDGLGDERKLNQTEASLASFVASRFLFCGHIRPDLNFLNSVHEMSAMTGRIHMPQHRCLWWNSNRIRSNAERDMHLRADWRAMLWFVVSINEYFPISKIERSGLYTQRSLHHIFSNVVEENYMELERKRDGMFFNLSEIERLYYFLEAEKLCQKSLRRKAVNKSIGRGFENITPTALMGITTSSLSTSMITHLLNFIKNRILGGIGMDYDARQRGFNPIYSNVMETLSSLPHLLNVQNYAGADCGYDFLQQEQRAHSSFGPYFTMDYTNPKEFVMSNHVRSVTDTLDISGKWKRTRYAEDLIHRTLSSKPSGVFSFTDNEKARFSLAIDVPEDITSPMSKGCFILNKTLDRHLKNWKSCWSDQERDADKDIQDKWKFIRDNKSYVKGIEFIHIVSKFNEIGLLGYDDGHFEHRLGLTNPVVIQNVIRNRHINEAVSGYPFIDFTVRSLRLSLFYHVDLCYASYVNLTRMLSREKEHYTPPVKPMHAYEFLYADPSRSGYRNIRRTASQSVFLGQSDVGDHFFEPETYVLALKEINKLKKYDMRLIAITQKKKGFLLREKDGTLNVLRGEFTYQWDRVKSNGKWTVERFNGNDGGDMKNFFHLYSFDENTFPKEYDENNPNHDYRVILARNVG